MGCTLQHTLYQHSKWAAIDIYYQNLLFSHTKHTGKIHNYQACNTLKVPDDRVSLMIFGVWLWPSDSYVFIFCSKYMKKKPSARQNN